MEKYNKYLVFLIVIVVLLMSIGYSALNKELRITGEVNYRPQNDVRITSFTTGNKPNEMTIQYADFSKHEVKLGYTTTQATSITYTVEVSNFSGVNMGILKIDGLEGNNVSVQEGIIGKKLVGPTENNTFNITFSSTQAETKTYLLTFDFEQVYTVTYNGFSNAENYKKEILEGEEYSQNFGSNAPKSIEVTMGGVALENYTYSEGTLTISNVSGDIEVTAAKACEFPSYTDSSGANKPILNGNMIPVVYSEECESWIKQDLDKSYDYSQQVWANAVTIPEDSKREKSLGVVAKNLVNDKLENLSQVFQSTNQGQANSTSNLTLVFNATSNGKISFDWRVSSEKYDKLTITVTIDGQSETVVNGVGEINSGSYESKEITSGSSVRIVADFKKDPSGQKNDDTAYIENLTAPWPAEIVPTGKYAWLPQMDYLIGSTYDFDVVTETFSLKNVVGHSFNVNDVGKYMCSDGLTTCSELYKITAVEGKTVKEVERYMSEPFKARDTYVEAPAGTKIPIWDINTMWVWVPRYSYTIKSEDGGTNYFGKTSFGNAAPTQNLPGEIDIKFIKNETETGIAQYIGDTINGWQTNEAFNFDGEKSGIWVGKFETTGSLEGGMEACTDINCDVSNVTVKPGLSPIVTQRASSFFYMARSMQLHNTNTYGFNANSGDLHMMKNDEWGAVAYLSQSKYGKYGNSDYTGANKEIYINNDSGYITGHSGGSPSASYSAKKYEYNDMTNLGEGKGRAGPGASTTGNITGIYDMSGGAYDLVMGVLEYDPQGVEANEGKIATAFSGFKGFDQHDSEVGTIELPDTKYYNKYKRVDPTNRSYTKEEKVCDGKICYGHALAETFKWYGDSTEIVYRNSPWLVRGMYYYSTTKAGIFGIYYSQGIDYNNCSRLVLAP